MGKTMYYDNVLISELMDGDHLEHHGVLGMKWGIRRYQSYNQVPRKSGEGGKEQGLARKKSKLEAKKAANSAKIKKYQTELAKPKSQKQMARAAKYKMKLDKVNKSGLTRAADQYTRFTGKTGLVGHIQNAKRSKYRAKLAKDSYKTDKYQAKISDLEYKNTKLDKRINKIDTKIAVNKINARRNEAKENVRNIYKNQDPNNQWMTKNDLRATNFVLDSEYDKEVRAAKKRR